MSASKDNPFGASNHQFQFQSTATLPSLQFNPTQRGILLNNQFTGYINRFQNNSTVTNQPNRDNDDIFFLNTITTTVFALL